MQRESTRGQMELTRELRGIIPPVITTFDKRGKFDERAQREVISFLVDKVQGFYPCGTYGSGPLMTVEERKRVAEVVIDEVAGRVPVIVHVGGAATQFAVELARHAEEAGATAVASVPPIYYGHKEPEVERHFKALLDAVSIPVFVYNNPKATGVAISPGFLRHLVQIGIAGVKDSSFDIMTFYDYIRTIDKEGFIPIIGTEALILPAVLMGARGSVAGLANAFPEPVVDLFKAATAGEIDKARLLQLKVARMREVMHFGPTIPMVQALLRKRGVNAGYPRLPFAPPDEAVVAKALSELEKLGVSF